MMISGFASDMHTTRRVHLLQLLLSGSEYDLLLCLLTTSFAFCCPAAPSPT